MYTVTLSNIGLNLANFLTPSRKDYDLITDRQSIRKSLSPFIVFIWSQYDGDNI